MTNRIPPCLEQYGRLYGSGYFDGGGRVTIYNPFDPNYTQHIRVDCAVYKDLQSRDPEYYPYKCYPEEGGIIPLGFGESGLQFWHGEPGVLIDNRSNPFFEYKMPVLEFLYRFSLNDIFFNQASPYFDQETSFVKQELPPLRE